MSVVATDECSEFHDLVLVLPQIQSVLLQRSHPALTLLQVSIPRNARPAAEITRAVSRQWALHSVVVDWIEAEVGGAEIVVLELIDPDTNRLPADTLLVPLDRVPDGLFSTKQLLVLRTMVSGESEDRGPLSHCGWVEDAKRWMRESINPKMKISGIEQHNAGGSFALLRFQTEEGQAFWLKAVGEPNRAEFGITAYLANECPQFLPKIRAMRSDWNAWIMEEIGVSLHASTSLADFEQAAVEIANIQKAFIGRTEALLASEFRDHRTATLRAKIVDVISYLSDAMKSQTSKKVPALTPGQLDDLGVQLCDSCSAMDKLGIPDSLLHGDISPGSILYDGDTFVFTDWCEAYVGNPFLTIEQFSEHAARAIGEGHLGSTVRRCYRDSWAQLLPPEQIDKALRLSPILAVLSYLYGRGDWLQSERRWEPQFMSYSRSLARRMNKIAGTAEFAEVLCQLK
jgi:hypothetical protein